MEAAQSQAIYVPEDALVGQVNVHDGDWVQQGQVLAVLTSDSLDYQIAQAKVIAANLAWQVAQQPFSKGLDEQGAALKKLALAAQQQIESLLRQQARLTLTAPFAGRIADASDTLKPGTVVVQGERLMQVLGKEGMREGWVDEDTVTTLRPGDAAFFVPDSGETRAIRCKVGQVDRLTKRRLTNRCWHRCMAAFRCRSLMSVLCLLTPFSAFVWTPAKHAFRQSVRWPEKWCYRVSIIVFYNAPGSGWWSVWVGRPGCNPPGGRIYLHKGVMMVSKPVVSKSIDVLSLRPARTSDMPLIEQIYQSADLICNGLMGNRRL
jgi:hypothetical protein